MTTLRTIILSQEAQVVIDRESELHFRLEEVFDGLQWRLARDPKSGYPIDRTYWVIRLDGDPAARIPAIVVLYSFDADEVNVWRILVKSHPNGGRA